MMKLSLIFVLSAFVYAVSCRETCLHGWDAVAAVKEKTLNKALDLSSFLLRLVKIPTITAGLKSPPKGVPGEEKRINLVGYRLKKLKLTAIDGQTQQAYLTVGFRSGSLKTVYKFVNMPAGTQTIAPRTQVLDVAPTPVTFRVTVTAYQLNVDSNGNNKYTVRLKIVEKDAIVGSLKGGYEKADLEDITDIRNALSTMMKRTLDVGKEMDLFNFALPPSFDKTLFPRIIRFTAIYNAGGNSVFALLVTSQKSLPRNGDRFRWQLKELNPTNSDANLQISKAQFVRLMIPALASELGISQSKLVMQSGCGRGARVYLSGSVGNWKGGATLKNADINFVEGTNKVRMTLKLEKDVSAGIKAYITINLGIAIVYKSGKGFTVTLVEKTHSTDITREWWVVFLEVISLGLGRIVTAVIEDTARNIINNNMNNIMAIGPGTGTRVVNMGGTITEIVKRIRVKSVRFINSNFVMEYVVMRPFK